MSSGPDSTSSPGTSSSGHAGAVLVRDSQACLPLSRTLRDGDLVVLLTPVVAPVSPPGHSPALTSDPFEPLGRALARHHPWIRHVPYTVRGGITSTHVGFIRRAEAVVFVISHPPRDGQSSQVELSEMARAVGQRQPHIIVACCSLRELEPLEATFPTVIRISGYSPGELESAADLIFTERSLPPSSGPNVQSLILAPKAWSVEVWNGQRDMAAVYELWLLCMPEKFHLHRVTLQALFKRDGYAMHYVVREPETGDVLGFCATYTTYIDSEGERLIGSLSMILVRPSSRQRGVGLSLHKHALRQLTRTRGVYRLQLGTTFPRLFYGLPVGSSSEDWFRRRGWNMDRHGPGTGQEASDWFLRIEDWPTRGFLSSDVSFTLCTLPEFESVLEFVERESKRRDNMGWYDQYAKLVNTMHTRDIVIGVAKEGIVATALTYFKNSGSPVADDLPWAGTIGEDVGGITCICIADDVPFVANKRDAIMIRLLDASLKTLSDQGMSNVFIDAVKGGDEGFQSMGFQRWASYRDVWRKA